MADKPIINRSVVMTLYAGLWYVALPFGLLYLLWRGLRDRGYLKHLPQRFGFGARFAADTWVHAVSLGEFRSGVPLIRQLLDRGDRVVITHMTPAGRRESERTFAHEITAGQVTIRWLPLEFSWAISGFLRRTTPARTLILEIEFWPLLFRQLLSSGVKVYPVNSQVPPKSFARAQQVKRWFGHPLQDATAAFVKSEAHAQRFRSLGAPQVQVTGELRFDQVPAPKQISAAALVAAQTEADLGTRPVITLSSVVEGEEATYLEALTRLQDHPAGRPLFIWVPRAPERFEATAELLEKAGWQVARRSEIFDPALSLTDEQALLNADILLGDSMGEMYFYLSLAGAVIIGGGFVPKGAHNVIEALSLAKPVFVGPHTWTIEFPFAEAKAADVAVQCADAAALAEALAAPGDVAAKAKAFLAAHQGASARTIEAITAAEARA